MSSFQSLIRNTVFSSMADSMIIDLISPSYNTLQLNEWEKKNHTSIFCTSVYL